MPISPNLLFHIQSCNTLHEVWAHLELLFGNQDTLRHYQLENELICLKHFDFNNIQDIFTKLKSLRLQLKQCGIENKDKHLILSLLSKLGPDYSIFISTLYASRDGTGSKLTMHSLDDFATSLM